jgi:UDP-glucuronate 4-epimerase
MILVTGAAGFIGFHVVRRLLKDSEEVIGVDNLNDYYDPSLKEARLGLLRSQTGFAFRRLDIADQAAVGELFSKVRPKFVVHLAAQAGVRYSLEHPHAYIESNITGFLNILENCRIHRVSHLVYASSSSVYGLNRAMPFSVHQNVDHPISLYGATKKSNELMAHCYSHLFRLPTTGLRFFTVYGPWGRPDMAYFRFTKAILEGAPIEIFSGGRMSRDFTYIDDIVEGVVRTMRRPASSNPSWQPEAPDPATSSAPYQVFNIGNHGSIELFRFVEVIEDCLGKKAEKRLVEAQPGDVRDTSADVSDLAQAVGFTPATPIETGLRYFTEWYRNYYKI